MEDCVFCRLIRGEAPAYVVTETKEVVVLLARENHPLIVTRQHVPDLYALDARTAGAVMRAAVRIGRALKSGLPCAGVNLVQSNGSAAGQDVFHFHLHVKPRWPDDGVILSWDHEPRVADVCQETLNRLRQALERDPAS